MKKHMKKYQKDYKKCKACNYNEIFLRVNKMWVYFKGMYLDFSKRKQRHNSVTAPI